MKKVFRRRRERRVKYCWRREDSRIKRLRYICGGDEGRLSVLIELAVAERRTMVRAGRWWWDAGISLSAACCETSASTVSEEAWARGGSGAGSETLVPGGGAPLTIWLREVSVAMA